MKYTVVEEQGDGRSYCVIEMDDGRTFGQMVDLRWVAGEAEADALALGAVSTATAIAKAIETRKNAPQVNRVGVERVLLTSALVQ